MKKPTAKLSFLCNDNTHPGSLWGWRLHSFNKYLLSTYWVTGPLLGTEDTAMSKVDNNLCPVLLISKGGETDKNKSGKYSLLYIVMGGKKEIEQGA